MEENSSYYKAASERKALETIYGFLSLSLLTDPECTVASSGSDPMLGGKHFSRSAGSIPPSSDAFRRKVSAEDWEAIVCVAGTEPTDTRRTALLYVRATGAFALNFPNSGKLTPNESAIKEWVRKSIMEG